MKKVMFLLAVAGMFAFAACGGDATTEENVEAAATEAIEQMEEAAAEATEQMEAAAAEATEQIEEAAAEATEEAK